VAAIASRIVWIDCEMTGLDLKDDALIEVAAVVTDGELNALDDGIDLVITPTSTALAQMGDFVREMHTTSGLITELDSGTTLEDAENQVLEYVKKWVPEPKKAPLAGSSVGTDKAFLERDMPRLTEHLHYRIVDVSSIKELAKRWYPRAFFAAPEKQGGHRALADIYESIHELRYYREVIFVPEPGPTTDEARQIAAKHVLKPKEEAEATSQKPAEAPPQMPGEGTPASAED